MVWRCMPIPGLTSYFKSITNSTSPLLIDYLEVDAALFTLNTITAATISAYDFEAYLDPSPEAIFELVMGRPYARRSLDTREFDCIALIKVVMEHREKFQEDPTGVWANWDGYMRPLGEMWLIGCAIHPEADIDRTLDATLGPYLGTIPYAFEKEDRSECFDCLGLSSCMTVDPSHPLPELAIAVKQVLAMDNTDLSMHLNRAKALAHVIQAFIRIGLNIVDAWQLCRHLQQPEALLNWGQEYQVHTGVVSAFARTVENPHSGLPVPLRSVIARVDVDAVIDQILHSKIPRLINEGTPAKFVSFHIYQWILEAAIHHTIDEDGEIYKAVREHFDGRWAPYDVEIGLRPELANYRPLDLPLEVHHVIPTTINNSVLRRWSEEQQEAASSRSVDFKLVGPPIYPLDVATVITSNSDDICAVCQDSFDDDSRESKCMKLRVCAHLFCSQCLDKILNRVYPHKDHVPCPCCRAAICPRRELAPVD